MAKKVSHRGRCDSARVKGKRRRLMRLLCVVSLGLVAAVAFLLWPRSKRLYRVTVLPSLGGRSVLPYAINEHGQVVGYSEVPKGGYHLFLWDRETGMRDLGPVGRGFTDLNDAGQIVGATEDANGVEQAFVWDPNAGRRLLTVPGAVRSRAYGINNRGWVVGFYETDDETYHAFVWDRARGMRDLGNPGEVAWRINDAGQVLVGTEGGTQLVQLDEKGNVVSRSSGPAVRGARLNNHGVVAGIARTQNSKSDVIVWHSDSGQSTSFQLDGDQRGGVRLNDAGQVCYHEERESELTLLGRTVWRGSRYGAYLWDPRRGRITLDDYVSLGRDEELWITDLNNKGCLVGAVQSEKHGSRGVLLEPIPERWEK